MRGNITINADETGVHLSVQVSELKRSDKAFLVHALGRALELNVEDYMVLSLMERAGALDKITPTMITIDVTELQKQMEEE